YVSIFFNETRLGTQTDIDGNFKISTNDDYNKLKFNYVGYEIVYKNIVVGQTQKLDVLLKSNAQSLNEVTIIAGKKVRYSNKNNPAVELIRQVIENRDKNQPKAYETVQYKEYEKMLFSMSNISEKFKNKRIFRNYQFLFQEQDSTQIGGKNLLPIYIQEKLADQYLSFDPTRSKTVVLAEKQVEFDNRFIDNQGMKAYFDRMYQNINIYDNNISVMSNDFLSPIANSAPTFYKFFITDTVKSATGNVIELSFTPRTKGDMLFEGKIYITMDGNYAVQKASFGVNKNINLNFVRGMEIELAFEKNTDSRYYLSKSNLIADFGISKNKGMGFTGERSVSYDQYKTNVEIPDTIFSGKKLEVLAGAGKRTDAFWSQNRLDSIPQQQLKIYSNIDTLQKLPSFRRTIKLVTFLFAGYWDFGPYEVGPTNTFYSFNNVEG
ncbi:MAG: carboxypeptidase-like regulatory domain-containing protein, partial [Pedobacter sp.]